MCFPRAESSDPCALEKAPFSGAGLPRLRDSATRTSKVHVVSNWTCQARAYSPLGLGSFPVAPCKGFSSHSAFE